MSNEVINPDQQFLDANGDPLGAGTLTFYVNLTTTLSTIYSDEALTIPQSNPYQLDASGRMLGDVKYTGKKRMVVKDVSGATIRTLDNVVTLPSGLAVISNVDTFLALATTPAELKQIINIRCHTSGTIGGGQFIAVSSSGLTPDGGTISVSATPGIYWKRIGYDELHVNMFGVIGNVVRASTVDEYVNLQKAFTAAQAAETNVLNFDAIYYRSDTTLTVTTNPIYLMGKRIANIYPPPGGIPVSIGTEIFGSMTGSPLVFMQNLNAGHGASNITFDANNSATYALHHDSCIYGKFDNCWFLDGTVFSYYGDARTATHSWSTFDRCRATAGYRSAATAAWAFGGYKGGYNACHNHLINTSIEHAGVAHGMLNGFCDNISFYGVYINRGTATYGGAPASTGYGVTFSVSVDVWAYGLLYFNLQAGNGGYYEPPGSYGGVYQIAAIYGYALDNVEPVPILATSGGYPGTTVVYNSGDSLFQKTLGVNMAPAVPGNPVYPLEVRARTTGSRGSVARFGQAHLIAGYDDIGFQLQGAHLSGTGTIIADNGVAGSGSASGVRWEGTTITFYSMPNLTAGVAVTVTDSIKALSVTQSGAGVWTYGVCGVTPSIRDTGYGTPTGAAKVVNFPGATATLAQTSGQLAALTLELKNKGLIGA
jgi:hypothetical protein